jgi:hypothetical protein
MKVTIGTLVLTLCAGAAAAQGTMPRGGARSAPAPAMDKAAVEKAMAANEQKINAAIAKGDAEAFRSLVGDDTWAIDETGMMAAADFAKMLKPGVAKITEMKLEGYKTLWVDANTAVITYTWSGKGTFMDQPVKSPILASTVYTKKGDKWVPVFHQETVKAAMPPAMKK